MLRPSNLIRLAVLAGLALFVRAIVHEAVEARNEILLPPPSRGKKPRNAQARPGPRLKATDRVRTFIK